LTVVTVHSEDPTEFRLIERRALRWLLVLYGLFILYGTFIPFRFNDDPAFLQLQWQGVFTPPFNQGRKTFSLLDVAANFLLFVPLGFLWVGSAFRRLSAAGFFGALLQAGLCGLLLSLAVELGQVYSPGRTPSILDVAFNAAGAAFGGALGIVIFTGLRGALGKNLLFVICWRPARVLLAMLAVAPVADAFYPFHLTLDVSTAWSNLKRAQWMPFLAGTHRYWLDLVVEKVFVYAAMAHLVILGFRQSYRTGGAGGALGFCFALGFAVEAGKLLFVGRVPNAENFLLAVCGALFGVMVVTPLSETHFCRRHGRRILLILALALMIYAQLSPFDWLVSLAELPQRWQRVEWLPLAAYYGADPQSALFDLGKKIFIAGPFGLLVAARRHALSGKPGRNQALFFGLAIGLILEACQRGLRSRTPSITDVLLFGAASWTGATLFSQRLRLMKSQTRSSNR